MADGRSIIYISLKDLADNVKKSNKIGKMCNEKWLVVPFSGVFVQFKYLVIFI